MKFPARSTLAGLLLIGLPLVADTSRAAPACGAEGQRACTVFQRVPSCNANLVERSAKCVHPDCGRDGQRACTVGERIPSCDTGLVELAGRCVVRGACGADGQRACAVVERVPSCNAGLVEQSARCVHPACGRENERACRVNERVPSCDGNLVEVAAKCVARGACGAEGQRACTVGERVPSCDRNLVETPQHTCQHPDCGRAGERGCKATDRAGVGVACDVGLAEVPGCIGECRGSSSTCFDKTVPLTEPTANVHAVAPPDPQDPLRGFADIHVHMFAHLAFGGGVLAGMPYDPNGGGVGKALAPDYGTDIDLVAPLGNLPFLPLAARRSQQRVTVCPPLVPGCGRNVFHGDHLGALDDFIGFGTDDATASYFGAPYFTGWPKWHSTTHQQVYYKWLERAWRGGMRLMTLLAVNNEVACGASKHLGSVDCSNSMPGIDAQLDAAIAFEAWLAKQPGGGWFHIVKDPDEAEQTIRAGKLAVVLGIEVDTLFQCKKNTQCENRVAADVERYFNKGVRHIYPNHDFDGGFAGTALFNKSLNDGNLFIEGAYFDTRPCPGISDALNCNKRGLTPVGEKLINLLIDKGMLIDIDHMSELAITSTVKIAKDRGGYPLMVGHGLFNEVHAANHAKRHERMRTIGQLADLKALNSLVSVMTQDEMDDFPNCKHSSKSFAVSYAHAVKYMAGPVAFGSDFNGVAPHVGPRFGEDACGRDKAQAARETNPLKYPFPIKGFGSFDKQVTGQRTFDFNTSGLAHIGLLPDLIGDLTQQGVDVEPLMHSAKAYVDTWRKARSLSKTPSPKASGGPASQK